MTTEGPETPACLATLLSSVSPKRCLSRRVLAVEWKVLYNSLFGLRLYAMTTTLSDCLNSSWFSGVIEETAGRDCLFC